MGALLGESVGDSEGGRVGGLGGLGGVGGLGDTIGESVGGDIGDRVGPFVGTGGVGDETGDKEGATVVGADVNARVGACVWPATE